MTKVETRLKQLQIDKRSPARAAATIADAAANDGLLDVAYTSLELPIGKVIIAATPRGLVKIAYNPVEDDVLIELAAQISPRVIEAPFYFDAVRRELDEYFEGRRTSFDLPIDWSLTGGFSRRVLRRTAKIPYGKVSTYREMARAAGSPRGARAAGNALGSNPIPIVVPCHRVLHSDGGLGGYGGGLDNKRLLLGLEGVLLDDGV